MNAGGISEKGRELAAKNREEFNRKKSLLRRKGKKKLYTYLLYKSYSADER